MSTKSNAKKKIACHALVPRWSTRHFPKNSETADTFFSFTSRYHSGETLRVGAEAVSERRGTNLWQAVESSALYLIGRTEEQYVWI